MSQEEFVHLLSKCREMAKEKGVRVSQAEVVFLVHLVEYAKQNHDADGSTNSEGALSVILSIDDMVKELNTPKRTVTEAVKDLTAAGVLIRTKAEKVKKRRGAAPMRTEINTEVYRVDI